jgi:hypothetical protein
MGEASAGCVEAEGGTSDTVEADAEEVPREVGREGVEGRLGLDVAGGGYGERARRPMEAENMGDCDCCVDGELLRCTSIATDATGEGTGTVRGVRSGESVGGVGGAAAGVLRPERVGKSTAGPGGGVGDGSGTCSAAGAVLRAVRGGKPGALEARTDELGAGAKMGTGGGTFSGGFGTRSALRINRKSRPKS